MRKVVAVLVRDGLVVSMATNDHPEPCKREGYPTGIGYELCKYCQYENHAEYKAVQGQKGGTLYLLGHTYACEPCKKAMDDAGVDLVLVT
jgi:deoxycytidylate deaminase